METYMAIVKWDPFRDLVTLRQRLDKLFEEDFPRRSGVEVAESQWTPSVDIHETDKALVVTAELPGVDEKDIDIEVDGRDLVLKGKRGFEKETKEENYQRIERSYGSFYRSFRLPDYVDVDHIEAKTERGLLKITLPKRAELKPKRVKILPAPEVKK
jgi:HSP20 family protein